MWFIILAISIGRRIYLLMVRARRVKTLAVTVRTEAKVIIRRGEYTC